MDAKNEQFAGDGTKVEKQVQASNEDKLLKEEKPENKAGQKENKGEKKAKEAEEQKKKLRQPTEDEEEAEIQHRLIASLMARMGSLTSDPALHPILYGGDDSVFNATSRRVVHSATEDIDYIFVPLN